MCGTIEDPLKIKKIVSFINNAMDWTDDIEPHKNRMWMKIGSLNMEVLFEAEKEIYLRSDEGIKMMKPDPEFLKLITF
ncbi:hypothetical protein [Radiobacillus deserti]|uniref:Uncharacterized protein n=1 Tax=Radiobacillus deserti TaxID=2594883 RepID=A0A516KI96_9BACI|nr:hypothetical protein [Radiobacillus deserti]QDP41101.1 hypothetical protein FN924_13415 [Radiobacillus deserti]